MASALLRASWSLLLLFGAVGPALAAVDHVKIAQEGYKGLRELAVTHGSCAAELLPGELLIATRDEVVGAGAFHGASGAPVIVVNLGLLDLDAVASYYSLKDKEHEQAKALTLVALKHTDGDASLRNHPLWKAFATVAPGGLWTVAYRSRIYLAVAHEMAHLCLRHTHAGALQLREPVKLANGNNIDNLAMVAGPDASPGAAVAPSPFVEMERMADQWAAELLRLASPEIVDMGPAVAQIGELALLDAMDGRSSLSFDPRRTHVVGKDRMDNATRFLGPEYSNYLKDVQTMILCLERGNTDRAAVIDALLTGTDTLCTALAAAGGTRTLGVPALVRETPRPWEPTDSAAAVVVKFEALKGLATLTNVKNGKTVAVTPDAHARLGAVLVRGDTYRVTLKDSDGFGALQLYLDSGLAFSATQSDQGALTIIKKSSAVKKADENAVEFVVPKR